VNHKPVILHGNNVDSNRGCQALRLTTQMILDRYLPQYPRLHANIFCSDVPQFHTLEPDAKSAGQLWETPRRGTPRFYFWGAGVVRARLLGRFPPMKVHRALDNAAALLAVGGDNLSYDYGFLATLLFFSPLHAAICREVPTMVWAASIVPFSKRPEWEKRFADLLRRVDLITVREPLTQEYLEELGVRDNIRRVTDPAFLLPACPTELPDEIEQALEAGAIGVNLAPLMRRYSGLSPGKWMNQAVDMVAEVRRKTTCPVILIPHVMMSRRVFPENDDYAFLRALSQRLPPDLRDGTLLYDSRNHSSKQIKWVISRLRVFAGSRLHSTIAALSSCVPTFSIGHSVKSRGINVDLFGHERWGAQVSQLTAGQLAERVQALLEEEAVVRSQLRSIIPHYSNAAWKNGEYLQSMLRERER
jgi:polysaccharide pyruvyl transferase WcaK-like protein